VGIRAMGKKIPERKSIGNLARAEKIIELADSLETVARKAPKAAKVKAEMIIDMIKSKG
jgi:hypothetical protein